MKLIYAVPVFAGFLCLSSAGWAQNENAPMPNDSRMIATPPPPGAIAIEPQTVSSPPGGETGVLDASSPIDQAGAGTASDMDAARTKPCPDQCDPIALPPCCKH